MLGSIAEDETVQIHRAIQRGQLTGSGKIIEEIEAKMGKQIEFRGQSRLRQSLKYIRPLFPFPTTLAWPPSRSCRYATKGNSIVSLECGAII